MTAWEWFLVCGALSVAAVFIAAALCVPGARQDQREQERKMWKQWGNR